MTVALDVTHDVYLGPASVLAAAPAGPAGRVQVALPTGIAYAQLALTLPYTPTSGDVVLTIGQAERYYVIGVLHHTGKATFTFPGDVEILAPRGGVRVAASGPVECRAPEVTVRAGRLTLVARTLVQRLDNLMQWVKDLVHLRGGRKNEQVAGVSYQQAERVYVRAEKEVKVNGDQIHLG